MSRCLHIWSDERYDFNDLSIKRRCYKCKEIEIMTKERQMERRDAYYQFHTMDKLT